MATILAFTIWAGPIFGESAHHVRLADFHSRVGERFLYEYDFGDCWEHQIRLERIRPLEPQRLYPVCIGGRRGVPPEDCGGVWAFQQARDEAPWRAQKLLGHCQLNVFLDGDQHRAIRIART